MSNQISVSLITALTAYVAPLTAQPHNSLISLTDGSSALFHRSARPADMPQGSEASTVFGAFLAHGLDGSRRWRTVISLINGSSSQVQVTVEFLNSSGPVPLPFGDERGNFAGRYSSAYGILDPGANVSPLLIDINDTVKAGYVRVTASPADSVGVDISIVRIDFGTTTAFLHGMLPVTSDTREFGIANSPGQTSYVGIVNPSQSDVDALVTARNWQGLTACSGAIHLTAGEQLWRSVNNVLSCLPVGAGTFSLRVTPVNGPLVLGAYYEQAGVGFSAAPLHTPVTTKSDSTPGVSQ